MKIRCLILLFTTFSSFLLLSCREEEIPLQVLPPVPGGDWAIYQLAKIHAPDIPVDDKSFLGTIGNLNVSLGRIPGDTLIFIVPNIGEGPAELKVIMGRQVRTWDIGLFKGPNFKEPEVFIEEFLTSTRVLRSKILEVESLKDLATPFGIWINFFDQKQQSITAMNRETLAGAFQFGRNLLFFSNAHESFQLPCYNSPESTMASMVYRFGAFDHSYLTRYSKLPKTAFNEAVVAGFGLSFWYQKVLLEYYAYQTLLCPVIQEIQLKDADSGKILQPNETLRFQPLVPFTLEPMGIFRRITKTDLEQGSDNLFTPTYGFKRKPVISKDFSDWIRSYMTDYQWELPDLEERPWVFAPDAAPISTGPVHGVNWYQPTMDNAAVRLFEYNQTGNNLTLIFENNLEEPIPFNLKIPLFATAYNTEFVFPATLETGCPLEINLYLIDRMHFLEIESGTPPFQITWSNGVTGELLQFLPPGSYEIKVTDADGCERIVVFPAPEYGTVEDIDGNVYETVKIGNAWWMAENLRTTRNRDGTAIALIESNAAWSSTSEPGYCWKDNDSALDESFGKLYNYHAACCDICPVGWRLPGIGEFSMLAQEFGQNSGRHMKDVNAWPEGSMKSTNLSGLGFLPSGFRVGKDGGFGLGTSIATFWTGNKDAYGYPYVGLLQGSIDYFSNGLSTDSRDGYSVRCVKE